MQEHHARQLHYDLRLELDGVLLSWAVPRGPSLDPSERRLAIRTEDHPLDYADFEGTIPAGQYGAGAVKIWDRGTWSTEADPHPQLERGKLTFQLSSPRLHGSWVLVRSGSLDGDERTWLLIRRRNTEQSSARALPGARATKLPRFIAPQLAQSATAVPRERGWHYELKLDGYRLLCRVADETATLLSRRGKDWTDRFAAVTRAVEALPCSSALLDGEVVVVDAHGASDFQALQRALRDRADSVILYAFDLLYLDGHDLRSVPLHRRRAALRQLLAGASDRALRFSDHVVDRGEELYRLACEAGAEGVIAKRADAPYRSGRSGAWLKIKCRPRQELVVVGFTEPGKARRHLGALLLATRDRAGDPLVYAGKVGTGFSAATLAELRERLAPLQRAEPPCRAAGGERGPRRSVHWVEPELVAEVSFAEFTDGGLVRQASFEGLREDKPADEVVREPAPARALAPPSSARSARAASGSESRPTEIEGVTITHPRRTYFPEVGLKKGDIARYYQRIAELMLPHLSRRPLTVVRCPEGIEAECFFQKQAAPSLPATVPRITHNDEGTRFYIDRKRALLALVQLGALEFHPSSCRVDRLDRPDQIIFDLDPGEDVSWAEIVAAALAVREELRRDGLTGFVRTTGGAGLHVVAPIARRSSWPHVKAYARAIAERLARRFAGALVARSSPRERAGKIYVDYVRNARGATAVASYSTRARPGAPLAAPLAWEALEDDPWNKPRFSVLDVDALLARADPWADFDRARVVLRKAALSRSGADHLL